MAAGRNQTEPDPGFAFQTGDMHQEVLKFNTGGRGSRDITAEVQRVVGAGGERTGLCQLFIQHTSASLMICENADPVVREDLERWLARAAPDGDALFEHNAEGDDDMPAHVRSILTGMDLQIPIIDGRLGLGTWQGIYLYEHRSGAHERKVVVTLLS